jgi:hypothetical protein
MERAILEQAVRQALIDQTVSIPGYGPAIPMNATTTNAVVDAVAIVVLDHTQGVIQAIIDDEGRNDSRL